LKIKRHRTDSVQLLRIVQLAQQSIPCWHVARGNNNKAFKRPPFLQWCN